MGGVCIKPYRSLREPFVLLPTVKGDCQIGFETRSEYEVPADPRVPCSAGQTPAAG